MKKTLGIIIAAILGIALYFNVITTEQAETIEATVESVGIDVTISTGSILEQIEAVKSSITLLDSDAFSGVDTLTGAVGPEVLPETGV